MKKLIIILIATGLCVGCSNWIVPRTKIKGAVSGQPFEFSSPKNYAMTNFVIEVITRTTWGDTNTTKMTIGSLTAVMDPAIVQMSGDTFIQGMQIVKEGVIEAAGKASGKP